MFSHKSYGPAYAGIGARDTPSEVLRHMKVVGENLAYEGYVLRSGHAAGADICFEEGAGQADSTAGGQVHGLCEIFLPWPIFLGSYSRFERPRPEAYEIAKEYHPNWGALNGAGHDLMARNSHQILGWELNDPVKFIVCWTKGGKIVGGTGQALRMAQALNIPVVNFGNTTWEGVIAQISDLIIQVKEAT